MTASWRALVVFVSLAWLAVPLAAQAQPGKVPRIGLLESATLTPRAPLWAAFRQGMRDLGYIEGQTVVFEVRAADGRSERLRALATALPIDQATKLRLVVNLQTAKALGLTVPPAVLARADEIIK